MFDFTEEQKLARKMVRAWAEKELAPLVPKMEKGELLPYDALRKFIRAFGVDEMAKARFARAASSGTPAPTEVSGNGRTASEAAMMAMVSIELSRVCPGFMLALGA